MKLVVGVTGHTGSGASTFAKFLEESGGLVISADKLAHEELKKGSEGFDLIVSRFSDKILSPSGEIDRGVLAGLVFGKGNENNLKALEGIIHPVVHRKIRHILKEGSKDNKIPFIVIDAPLLIESGMNKDCDITVFVKADREIRINRIIERDGLDFESAIRRIESRQEPMLDEVDIVIDNNKSKEDLHNEAGKFIMSHK